MSARRATLPALTVAALLAGAIDARSQATQSDVSRRFVGAWRYVGTTIDGVAKPRGNDPKGMIYYGPHGEMSVQIAPDVERRKAGAVMTAEEAKIAVTNYVAYFGNYTIDETAQTVTHHRAASLQPGDVAAVVRRFEFVGDRLILRPPNSTQEITWERIK